MNLAGDLPTPLAPPIGRERVIAAIVSLLGQDGGRLLTLTGPGGVGKTRLALQLAADLGPSFESGTAFVDLAPVRDPDLVISAIAQALGVYESAERDPLTVLADAIGSRRLLLILDNLEQVMAAALDPRGIDPDMAQHHRRYWSHLLVDVQPTVRH